MNKQHKYTFGGGKQDISKSKHPNQFYYDAQHIRIMATDDQTTGDVTNEKGTELVIKIPSVTIIGADNIPVVANPDSATITAVNGSVFISVLNNDVYLDDVTVTITVAAVNGTTEILSDNRIRYTDTSGVDGTTDSFTYQIDDGTTTDTAVVSTTVTVPVVADPDEPGDYVELIDNYDGSFYYYRAWPCDINMEPFVIASQIEIKDNRVVKMWGAVALNVIGTMMYAVEPEFTAWVTNGTPVYDACPPQNEIPDPEYIEYN